MQNDLPLLFERMGYFAGAVVALFLAVALIKRVMRAVSPAEEVPRRISSVEMEEALVYAELPKCVCGEVATEPLPQLKRSRGTMDWLRAVFAAPPRYKRVVDNAASPSVCKFHAHVADAMMEQFIFTRVRGAYSDLNATIAIEAAAFEQESLLQQIADSLTNNQKKARKGNTGASVLKLPQKTGTDDSGNGS